MAPEPKATAVADKLGQARTVPSRDNAAPGHSRCLVLRDRDGRRTAVARRAMSAVCEMDEGGSLLLPPGGRVAHMEEGLGHSAGLAGLTAVRPAARGSCSPMFPWSRECGAGKGFWGAAVKQPQARVSLCDRLPSAMRATH